MTRWAAVCPFWAARLRSRLSFASRISVTASAVQGACGRRATWRIRRAAGNVAAQEKVGQELFSTFLRFAFGFWYRMVRIYRLTSCQRSSAELGTTACEEQHYIRLVNENKSVPTVRGYRRHAPRTLVASGIQACTCALSGNLDKATVFSGMRARESERERSVSGS